MNKPIRIALLGLGTVGSGVYKLIHRRAQEMPQIAGAPIEISHILVRNTTKERPGVDSSLLTDNWTDIVNTIKEIERKYKEWMEMTIMEET